MIYSMLGAGSTEVEFYSDESKTEPTGDGYIKTSKVVTSEPATTKNYGRTTAVEIPSGTKKIAISGTFGTRSIHVFGVGYFK